ncbi:hypothetical protein M758_7G174200 [Ceratodon purpureus]|uniref:Uncharacterized protein n=1 Tax=Ceratodon purpureus TaxID=3225 RepID=A0A8T0HAS4_CERPU|nr:hypothetical protein KC19_7G177200 [Ceratodon purpureus]KAG0611895.1 hypothetical protein M758_7G174200 [Ceratodon purpureus]
MVTGIDCRLNWSVPQILSCVFQCTYVASEMIFLLYDVVTLELKCLALGGWFYCVARRRSNLCDASLQLGHIYVVSWKRNLVSAACSFCSLFNTTVLLRPS